MPTKKELEKKHRNYVYSKFNGRCAFCGHPLERGWHIWKSATAQLKIVDAQGAKVTPGAARDLPACVSCSSTRLHHSRYKTNKELLDIEEFRQALYHEFEFMSTSSMAATYYKKAIRFGLIQETNKPIVFYFEQFS